MKQLSRLFLGAIFAVSVATFSWAMWGSNPSLQGTIQDINANTLTVASDKGGSQINLQTNGATQLGTNISSLSDLKQGDHVQVSYKQEGGQKIATAIDKDDSSKAGAASTM